MILESAGQLDYTPSRIISLVPSQTELLSDLGLEAATVGITKFCVHPNDWFRNKTRVGGTKDIRPGIIEQLRPDLIIANKEENMKDQVESLAESYPVWVTDIHTLGDALDMIGDIGQLTGTFQKAVDLQLEIRAAFDKLQSLPAALKTAYLIWRNPYMSVGGDTFISNMLSGCGFQNIFSGEPRYPAVTVDQLRDRGCELLLLSSEPYPFQQKHIDELQRDLPGTKILLVDGEMFSWYGSRIRYAPAYFNDLLLNITRL